MMGQSLLPLQVIVVWSVKDRAMIDAMQFQNSGNRDAYLPLSFQPPMQPPPRIRSERISPGREDQDGLEAGADSNDMQRINSKYVFFNEFYMTQVRSADDFNAADINPEVQKWLKFGRPNLDELFARVKEMCMVENISRVGVCVCGPAPLVADVRDRCSKTLLKPSQGTVRFDCHSELFDF